jgi:hypothetical protein
MRARRDAFINSQTRSLRCRCAARPHLHAALNAAIIVFKKSATNCAPLQISAQREPGVVERLRAKCIVAIMRRGDVICPQCKAGFRRIELASRKGVVGEYRCPLCQYLIEVFDGSTDIAYRLTVAPEKMFE